MDPHISYKVVCLQRLLSEENTSDYKKLVLSNNWSIERLVTCKINCLNAVGCLLHTIFYYCTNVEPTLVASFIFSI